MLTGILILLLIIIAIRFLRAIIELYGTESLA